MSGLTAAGDVPWVASHSAVEVPVFLDTGEERLCGFVTRPDANASSGLGVLLLAGGWYGTSAGRNAVLVQLARLLAADGHVVLRFDYHGVGDSTGAIDRFWLAQPFTVDAATALRRLLAEGVARVVLCGVCFGGRTALALASDVDRLAGLVLVSTPVGVGGDKRIDRLAGRLSVRELLRRGFRPAVLRGLLDPRMRRAYRRAAEGLWSSLWKRPAPIPPQAARGDPSALPALEDVLRRRVPVLVINGSADGDRQEFEAARSGRLGPALDAAGDRVSVVTLEGSVSGFTRVELQHRVVARVGDFCRTVAVGDD